MTIDTPGISIEKKTNEQNLQIIKGYLDEMADLMNIYMAKVDELEAKIGESEG
ncbi:MAG: hypothetical protein ACLUP2_04425 [Lachnospiraceae bacterium]